MYTGLLIKESLSDERILDLIEIKNVDIWVTDKEPKYWTAVLLPIRWGLMNTEN